MMRKPDLQGCVRDDGPGLGDRGVHGRDGRVRLCAGVLRRRPVARRVRRRGVPRHPPGAAPAPRGRRVALRPDVRADGRAVRRRRPGHGARGPRPGPAPPGARAWARRRRRRPRAPPSPLRRAGDRLDRRRGRPAELPGPRRAPRRAALGRAAGAQRGAPASGSILNALARFDPFPRISGPPIDVARPTRPSRATRRSRPPAPGSCGSWARRAGWGSRARAGWRGRALW